MRIGIFHDAVEILSLGWLVERQNPEEHLSGESVSSPRRNKLIAQTMYRSGDIEAYGTGIPRMRDLRDEAGACIEYVRAPEGTKLVFHRSDVFADGVADSWPITADGVPKISEAILDGLSEIEVEAYAFLEDHDASRTAEVAEALGLSSRGILKVLKKLAEKGVVLAQGSTSDRTYLIRDDAR